MFGDYTIEQAAITLDTSDEVVEETVKNGGIPTRRKYFFFGPLLLDKPFVDSISPEVRAFMQRNGGTRADWERKNQERELAEQQLKQSEEELEKIREKGLKNQEDFARQMNDMLATYANQMIEKIEAQRKDEEGT
jgi:hypothetical protein